MNTKLHQFTLANGLRAAVAPSDASPVVALYLSVQTGAAHEPPGLFGAAHLLEHMLFKGTHSRGVGACAAQIEGMGGDLNAFTSHDRTVLHATVAAPHWREALEVLVDMARRPLLDGAELDRERQVVIEEIGSYEDNPDSVLSDAMAARIFGTHPYGRPVLGTVASVRGIDRAALEGFWRRGWVARRAQLGVAGQLDPAALAELSASLLGDWGAGEPAAALPQARPPRGGVLHVDRPFSSALVELDWSAPALGHPDVPALDVLAAALGQGAASLLTTRLQHDQALVSEPWAALWSRPGGGVLSAGFLPRPGATREALREALHAFDAVHRHGLDGVSIDRARASVLTDFLFGAETVDGRAHDLVWYLAHYGDPNARRQYRDAVAAVTPDDIQRVARRWLQPGACVVGVVDTQLSPRATQRVLRKHRARPQPNAHPEAIHEQLPGGAQLWVLPDDSPVAGIQILAQGGGLAVDPAVAGLSMAWTEMITSGCADLDATGFAEAVDDLAGTIDGVAGHSSLGLSGSFPASAAAAGLALMGEALARPSFSRDTWQRVRDELRDDVRTQRDRPDEVAHHQLWAALWQGHPWSLPGGGTLGSLARISTRRLRAWHHSLLTQQSLVIVVAGGVQPDAIQDALSDWLSELPPGPAALPSRGQPRGVAPVRPRRAGHEQAQVLLGCRGVALEHPARPALELAAAMLGAQGGRLFLDLRERRSLAYGVWAHSSSGLDGGVFQAGLATAPERVNEATDALEAAVQALATTPPSSDELARACRMLLGQAAVRLQRASARAGQAAAGTCFGVPWSLEVRREALEAVTPAMVSKVLAGALSRSCAQIIVRPR